MSKLQVKCFSISIDGYAAGPEQSLENPLGKGGMSLHEWFHPTRTFQRTVLNKDDGVGGVDDDFARRGFENIGAWILGRNMFGPIRGEWPEESWKGWWGANPPFHVPVFVITHFPRPTLEMEGGTVFHFVAGGIHEALRRAIDAAKDKNVRLGGGVATIRQYLQAGLVDELHLAISPTLLGSGEHLLRDIDLVKLGYRCTEHVTTEKAMHVILTKEQQRV